MKSTRTLSSLILIFLLIVVYLPIVASATSITISSFQLGSQWQYGGTTAKLRIYSSKSFTDSTGVPVMGGSAGSTTGFYKEINCTIDPVTKILSVPTFTLPSTTDAFDVTATYTGVLFDSQNRARDTLFRNYRLPTTPNPMTWLQWTAFNTANIPVRDTQTYNKTEVNNLIQAITPASPATVAGNGVGEVDVDPVDSLHPVFVGENSPLVREYNVEKYGANPLDAVDDRAAIMLARDAACNTSGAGKLKFPSAHGFYRVSSAIPMCSSLIVEGVGGGNPDNPYDDVTQPVTGSVVQLTTVGTSGSPTSIFSYGEHIEDTEIRDITLLNLGTTTGTVAIYATGENPDSSTGHTFTRVFTQGFEYGIKVKDGANGLEWQFDNIKIRDCRFTFGKYGVWNDTANFTNVTIDSPKCALYTAGNCIHLEDGSTVKVSNAQTVGAAGQFPNAMIYLGVRLTKLIVENSVPEGPTYFIDTEDSVIQSSSGPLVLIGNLAYNMRFRHSRNIISIGNTYDPASAVTSGANAGDIKVWSLGDSIRGSGSSITQTTGNPFASIYGIDSNRVTMLGYDQNVIDARNSEGLTVKGAIGVGDQVSKTRAVLTAGGTATQESLYTPVIQLQNSADKSINYNILRDPASGDQLNLGTQAASTAFWFNGLVRTSGVNFLAVSGVADAVTNSTTTVTSATANFTAAMVGAQVILSDATHTHITTIASRTSATEVVLTVAPSWTATGVRIMIAYNTGITNTVRVGAPSGACVTGSWTARSDGTAGATFYGCENSAWVTK